VKEQRKEERKIMQRPRKEKKNYGLQSHYKHGIKKKKLGMR
jgi:hypothetical protein